MRLPCSTLATFRSDTQQSDDMTWARLADISVHGACLVTKPAISNIAKGDVLELELGANKPVHAIGRVMYAWRRICRQLDRGLPSRSRAGTGRPVEAGLRRP